MHRDLGPEDTSVMDLKRCGPDLSVDLLCRVPQGQESGAGFWRQADKGGREGAPTAAHAAQRQSGILLSHWCAALTSVSPGSHILSD